LFLYSSATNKPELVVKSGKFASKKKNDVLDLFLQKLLGDLTSPRNINGVLSSPSPGIGNLSDDLFQKMLDEFHANPYYMSPTVEFVTANWRTEFSQHIAAGKLSAIKALEIEEHLVSISSTTKSILQEKGENSTESEGHISLSKL
jgi:hypothetical protein